MGQQVKPRLAKGTRDFSPADMSLRNYILDIIKEQFFRFGFEQIETPAVENLETLTGKYGEEGDQLIFKILNSGDYLKKADEKNLESRNSNGLIPSISEKALRYDLTVPFARYVVQHRNDIIFPFRRFQIQPVWRADRPQKGRYREFYQCDADVIGSDSMLLEAEFIELILEVFKRLSIGVTVKVNSRKILYGFCEANGIEGRFIDFTTVLDKLDKKPWTDLVSDFKSLGFSDDLIKKAETFSAVNGLKLSKESLRGLSAKVTLSESGMRGIDELSQIAEHLVCETDNVEIDLSLARGLNYYTGAIIEVKAKDVEIGSLCGGGRYDNLTGIFGLPDVSGIGISFGIDRLYDILKERSGEKVEVKDSVHVVFVNFGKEEVKYSLLAQSRLRNAGIRSEIYPDADKLKKQFKYADQKSCSHVVTAGESEIQNAIYRIKELKSGDQYDLTYDKMQELLLKS